MLDSRVYILKNISETKRLSELPTYNQHGEVRTLAGIASPVSINRSNTVSLHVKITNAVGVAGGKIGCYLYGINPKDVPFLGLEGVYYEFEVPFTGNEEIMLDILGTGASFIDPVIKLTAGSCDVAIIMCGKE